MNCLKVIIVIITIIMSVISGCHQTEVNYEQEINDFMSSYNANSSFPYNGNILVFAENKVLLSDGYGLADAEEGIDNKEDLVFPIGSITKSFTATAIMQLVENKKLSLEDNISDYVKIFDRSKEVTLHHLLTHTSGLPREGKVSFIEPISLNENIDYISKQELLFTPGSSFSYSNAGYILLAKVIEEVSEMPYNEYLTKHIFKPLEMNNSRGGIDATYAINQAIGYTMSDNKYNKQSIFDFSIITGSGNIYSTIQDLYKFSSSYFSNELLSEESVRLMTKNQTGFTEYPYGYGWEILTIDGHETISHSGKIGGGGYNSLIVHYKKQNMTLILLSNISNSTATKVVADSIAAICLGDIYVSPKSKENSFMSEEKLKSLEGKYYFNESFFIKTTYKDNSLFITADDGNLYELIPVSENVFQYKSREWVEASFNVEKSKIILTIQNINDYFEFTRLIN